MSLWRASVGLAFLSLVGGIVRANPPEAVVVDDVSAAGVAAELATFGATASVTDANAWSSAGGPVGGDCAVCEDDCCCPPLWTVQAGAIILSRSSRSALLLEDTVTGDPLLDASDFNSPWAVGVEFAIRRQLDDCRALEVRYFQVDGWESQETITTSPIWNFPTDPPLFGLGVATIDASYATRLYSTEINLRRASSDWLTWLVGFRWVELYEDLALNADFGGNAALVEFTTANRLYGGQVGADAVLWDNGSALRVDGIFKAGLFGNASSQEFAVTQSIGPAFTAEDSQGELAFLGEINFVGVYQWTDNIALRGGYQLLWLEGIATAPDQVAALDVLGASGIDTTGSAFYHGALLGVEVAW
jgi:hypothetical protein